jgi:hypothetical protein
MGGLYATHKLCRPTFEWQQQQQQQQPQQQQHRDGVHKQRICSLNNNE